MVVLTAAYVAHVISAALWTGATLYVVYALWPEAMSGQLSVRTFVSQVHKLLLITRWTGVVLPVTGAYLIWVLYTPLELLIESQGGLLVLAMLALWGVMNGLIEVGILQMRNTVDEVSFGPYMAEGFPTELVDESTSVTELAALGRPYLLASAVCAVALLVVAALLAGGTPF